MGEGWGRQEPAGPKDRKHWYLRKGVALFSHLAAPLPSNLNICQQDPPGPLPDESPLQGELTGANFNSQENGVSAAGVREGQVSLGSWIPCSPLLIPPRKHSEGVGAIVNHHRKTSQRLSCSVWFRSLLTNSDRSSFVHVLIHPFSHSSI